MPTPPSSDLALDAGAEPIGQILGPEWLHRTLLTAIAACSEAMFPSTSPGVPDWRTTEMVARTVGYLGEVPPRQRRMLMALFLLVEFGTCLLALTPHRFSRLPVERRTRLVRGWRDSPLLPLRLLGDALKATTSIIFISHRSVLAHMGAFATCEHRGESLGLPVRPGALPLLQAAHEARRARYAPSERDAAQLASSESQSSTAAADPAER